MPVSSSLQLVMICERLARFVDCRENLRVNKYTVLFFFKLDGIAFIYLPVVVDSHKIRVVI